MHTITCKECPAPPQPHSIWSHPSLVMFLHWTLPSICHLTYIHTSKGHMTGIIKKVNRIPTHCGVANESVRSLARGHVIRVCICSDHNPIMWPLASEWKIICHTTMCRSSNDFLYNPGHRTLWYLEVVPVVYARVMFWHTVDAVWQLLAVICGEFHDTCLRKN